MCIVMKYIFYKDEYKYIYLSEFFRDFARALGETFGAVMLYKAGLPIYLILLIYGVRFLITGLITPFFITISNKIGLANCILISNIFSVINAYFMLFSDNLYSNIIIFIITMGLMGLANPVSDALSSKYVNSNHRGRFNSGIYISKILGTVFASTLITWGVVSNNNTILLILITVFFLLQYITVKKIDYKPKNNNAFKTTFKYLLKSESKYKVIYALRTNHIIERLFVPLYLYILLNDFVLFGTVIIVSLLFQIITVSLIGKYTDKNLFKANNLVSGIKVLITGVYLLTKNRVLVSLNKTLSDNFDKVYETSIQTSIQNIIKKNKESNELLSAVGQMSLCFAEVIIFGVLSVVSIYVKENVFYLIFVLSIISTIFINYYIKWEINEKRKAR